MATYYMRADGTATSKTGATSASAASTSMNQWVHNAETFSAGDTIVVSGVGGVYYITSPGLAASGSNKAIAYTSAFKYMVSGTTYTSGTAEEKTVTIGGSNLPTAKYGAWACDINTSGTVSTTPASDNATGYSTAALALAGLPAVAGDACRMGTLCVYNNSGANFIPNTTSFGASGVSIAFDSNPLISSFYIPSSGSSGNVITYTAANSPTIDGTMDAKGALAYWEVDTERWWRYWTGTRAQTLFFVKGSTSGPGFRRTANPLVNIGDNRDGITFISVKTSGTGAGEDPTSYYDEIRASAAARLVDITNKSYVTISGLNFRRHWVYHVYVYPTTITLADQNGGVVLAGSNNITVQNCTFTDMANCFSSHNSTDITISGNTGSRIYNDTDGDKDPAVLTYITNCGVAVLFTSSSTTIQENTFNNSYTLYNGTAINNTGDGIIGFCYPATNQDCADALIKLNDVSRVMSSGILIFGKVEPSGQREVNAIIERNTVHHGNNAGTDGEEAVDMDGMAVGNELGWSAGNYYSGVTVRRNWVDGFGNSGWQTANDWRGVNVYYNLFTNIGAERNNWGGIKIKGYCTAYNNTLYNIKAYNAAIVGQESGGLIKNNIIHTVVKNSAGHGSAYGIMGGSPGATGSHNCIYNTAGSSTYNFTNSNGVAADPLFVNGTGGYTAAIDFRLQAGSPCRNAGASVGLTEDYEGSPVPR